MPNKGSMGLAATLTAALVAGLTTVLGASPGVVEPAAGAELRTFRGCAELERYYRDAVLPSVTAYGWGQPGAMESGAVPGDAGEGVVAEDSAAARSGGLDSAQAPSATGSAIGSGATGTNVQESGVDEPDIAKTDGRHLVTLSDGALRVVDTDGGSPRVLGSLPLTLRGAQPLELLLAGDRALVLGAGQLPYDPSTAPEPVPSATGLGRPSIAAPTTTRLTLVDLSDPADPQVISTADVDGSYVTAREHDGRIRLVLRSVPQLAFDHPQQAGAAAEERALAANRAAVRAATAEDWLPRVQVRGSDGTLLREGALLDCAAVHHPRRPDRQAAPTTGMVSVLTVDPAVGLDAMPSTAVTAAGDQVYASTSRLYVASAAYSGVTTPSTRLHAFDVTGSDAARYVASGSVSGQLLSRWAMSEHEGRLRVATTRQWVATSTGAPATDSQVVVLAERGRRLVRVGAVGGLGRGETIRAVRWFGDLATVVTFRQTDPLYTVDLSEPRRPRVLGELKIPGFSAYLHPLGDDLLLGVGQDADRTGQVRGLQASAFDLSRLAAPRRLDALDLGASWSPVLDDSRAFSYLPEQRLAIVPVQSWDVAVPAPVPGRSDRVVPPVGGAVALRVGADGALHYAGRLAEGTSVTRAVPVRGSLALVGAQSVQLYDADSLTETGAVRLG